MAGIFPSITRDWLIAFPCLTTLVSLFIEFVDKGLTRES